MQITLNIKEHLLPEDIKKEFKDKFEMRHCSCDQGMCSSCSIMEQEKKRIVTKHIKKLLGDLVY